MNKKWLTLADAFGVWQDNDDTIWYFDGSEHEWVMLNQLADGGFTSSNGYPGDDYGPYTLVAHFEAGNDA